MDVVDQQQPLAFPRVLERHAAREATIPRGDSAAGAVNGELFVVHCPQRCVGRRVEPGDSVSHGSVSSKRGPS